MKRALLLAAVFAAPAGAAVERAGAGGFVVVQTVSVAASPTAVWRTLVTPARWWSSQHSWSGDAANLTLDPRPGGCFCERLPAGGGVEHLRVVYAAPGKQLRLAGALGPLQGEGVAGAMTIALAAEGSGTKVTLRYAVGGETGMGNAKLAPLVDGMLAEQVARLKAAAEAR